MVGRYYSPLEIERARDIDLLTYLRLNEPENLVHIYGETYCTREHDSLKISNGMWMWWSRGVGGASALDYLIKVKGHSFQEAMSILAGDKGSCQSFSIVGKDRNKRKLLLPEECESTNTVMKYLRSRGIDKNIVQHLIDDGMLYESYPYHNCIFVGRDEEGEPRYAMFRACTEQRIMGEAIGSDKRYAFRIEAERPEVHVFESAIDAISYATIKQRQGRPWNEVNLLSLGGASVSVSGAIPLALREFLLRREDITEIHLHLDNDFAGRAASKQLEKNLVELYEVHDEPPSYGKDYNDHLKELIYRNRCERR